MAMASNFPADWTTPFRVWQRGILLRAPASLRYRGRSLSPAARFTERMPIDRHHAFAGAPAYGRRLGWWARLTSEGARRAVQAWRAFDRHTQAAPDCLLGPNAWCWNAENPDRIVLEAGAVCRGILRVELFGNGRIVVGSRTYVGDDCLLSSSVGIEIGPDSLIAHGVQIFDNDSHPVEVEARKADYAAVLRGGERQPIAGAPIRIGAHTWIGFGAIILKGVTIGEGSVVGAGSVVTRDVPAFSVAAGNPAVVIKDLRPASERR